MRRNVHIPGRTLLLVSPRLLVVEDEEAITDAVRFALTKQGFGVDVAPDGEAALAADPDAYDLIILDLMLPGIDGLEVCRRYREQSVVPILMLTARTEELDRVLGLEVGADDYVPKPFSMAELIGRVRAILRRREMDLHTSSTSLQVGHVRMDLRDQTVTVDSSPVDLTQSEFRLLSLLAARPDQAVSRRDLVRHLWRNNYVGERRTCDVHVKNLRRKIERDPGKPRRIVTVRGVGYMLRSTDSDERAESARD
jgi:two-component system, OmpR family, response regulator RegX3